MQSTSYVTTFCATKRWSELSTGRREWVLRETLTVHACVCWSSPRALEETGLLIALTAGGSTRRIRGVRAEARHRIAEHKVPPSGQPMQGERARTARSIPAHAVRIEPAAFVTLRDVHLREVPTTCM